MKTLFYMVVEKPPQKVNQERKRPSDGNVDIDYVPNDKNSRSNKHTDGEYVEYEEVK